MPRLASLIRSTQRFRLTLTALLVLGGLFFALGSKGQPQPASPEPDQAAAESPATPTAPATDNPPAQTEPETEPENSPSIPTAPAEAKTAAETLLSALSKQIPESPTPEAAEIPQDIRNLTYDSGNNDGLRAQLDDKETAGETIHDLRKYGLIPMKSVRWLNGITPDIDASADPAETPDAILFGIVGVDDKPNPEKSTWHPRSRAIRIEFKQQGDRLLISKISRPSAMELSGPKVVEDFLSLLKNGQAKQAWDSGSPELRNARTPDQVMSAFNKAGFLDAESFTWDENTTAIEGGFKLNGLAKLPDGTELPFYAALLETSDGLELLDLQPTSSFFERLFGGRGDALDITLAIVALALLLGFLYILFSYVRGLKGSPRELYILFFTKVTEYSAYGAAQLAFMFYLREDLKLGEIGAGSYYSAWSTVVTATTMAVGAVCDAIGIKKTLIIGSVLLLLSRAVMPFADGILLATIFGFLPLGIGIAITGPVLSVGIKRFTTTEGAALGFGLFYTLMNVGWAIGAKLFDVVQIRMGEMGRVDFLGDSLSTWQVLFGIGFFINVPDLIALIWMREGVEMTDDGIRFPDPQSAKQTAEKSTQSLLARSWASTKAGAIGTVKIFSDNFIHKAFWVFILLIGITVFTRLTFFHFHITWPSYGLRYFGQGSLVGNVFGVLNPLLIVFLVPVIAYLTRRASSYWLLLIGTIVSVASTVIVILPPEVFSGLIDTWFGAFVYDRWLEVPVGNRDPFYLSMVLFVTVFTLGEAIWSPRLMQFTAEIAPPGREGSYISLSYLPYFGAKFIVGPMAGFMLAEYAPDFGVGGIYGYYPDHQMIWWWVGGTAALTPIGMLAFRKLYKIAEDRAAQAARTLATEKAAEAG